MRRTLHPKTVGAFVIAAVVLGVLAAIYLGAGRVLQHRVRFVVVFSEDLSGLEVDAPVKFRGVPVGRVASIHISLASATEPLRELHLPVIIEINETRLREMGGELDLADPRTIGTLVDHGLRARLALESLLANRRYVALDVLPGAPRAPPPRPGLPYPEIPVHAEPGLAALQANASKLIARLEGLDLEGLVGDLRRGASSLDRAASRFEAAVAGAPSTLRAADAAFASLGGAARAIEAGVPPLTADARAAVGELRATLQAARGAVHHVDQLVDPASPLAWQLSATLAEVQSASRALRHLAEGLDRDPSAIVRGRAEARR
jgi:paraquat-inducible protein B